jgi:hypothetical protein
MQGLPTHVNTYRDRKLQSRRGRTVADGAAPEISKQARLLCRLAWYVHLPSCALEAMAACRSQSLPSQPQTGRKIPLQNFGTRAQVPEESRMLHCPGFLFQPLFRTARPHEAHFLLRQKCLERLYRRTDVLWTSPVPEPCEPPS